MPVAPLVNVYTVGAPADGREAGVVEGDRAGVVRVLVDQQHGQVAVGPAGGVRADQRVGRCRRGRTGRRAGRSAFIMRQRVVRRERRVQRRLADRCRRRCRCRWRAGRSRRSRSARRPCDTVPMPLCTFHQSTVKTPLLQQVAVGVGEEQRARLGVLADADVELGEADADPGGVRRRRTGRSAGAAGRSASSIWSVLASDSAAVPPPGYQCRIHEVDLRAGDGEHGLVPRCRRRRRRRCRPASCPAWSAPRRS